MDNLITVCDYNADWALKEGYLDPKPVPGFMSREEVIRFYGTLGIDGVEIREDYWSDCPPSFLRKITREAGLPIYAHAFTVDLAQRTAPERRAAADRARAMLDRSAEMGAKLAMIFPGEVKEGVEARLLHDWVVEGLIDCSAHAAALGITLVFENIDYEPWRPIYGTPQQCVEICKAVNSPALRLVCDVCALLFVEQDPLEGLRTMAPYVVHLHLKNSRPVMPGEKAARSRDTEGGRRLTGTVLDGGLVSIAAILDELKSMDYRGRLLIEYQGENDPRVALRYNLEYLRRQMQGR